MTVGTSAHGSGSTWRYGDMKSLSFSHKTLFVNRLKTGLFELLSSGSYLSDGGAVLLSFAAAVGGERGRLDAFHVLHQGRAHDGHRCYPPIQVQNRIHILQGARERCWVAAWGQVAVNCKCRCVRVCLCTLATAVAAGPMSSPSIKMCMVSSLHLFTPIRFPT